MKKFEMETSFSSIEERIATKNILENYFTHCYVSIHVNKVFINPKKAGENVGGTKSEVRWYINGIRLGIREAIRINRG